MDSRFTVYNGSITIKGTNAGLEVRAGTSTERASVVYYSSVSYTVPEVTGFAVLFSSDGVSGGTELYVKDAAGNQTVLSPHNDAGEWVFYSVNARTGKVVYVNMEKMISDLEKLMGKKYIHDRYGGED